MSLHKKNLHSSIISQQGATWQTVDFALWANVTIYRAFKLRGTLFGCELRCLRHSVSESHESVQAKLSWFNKDDLSRRLLNKPFYCCGHPTICLDWNKWIHNITETTLCCCFFSLLWTHASVSNEALYCTLLQLGIIMLMYMGALINTSHFVLFCI